MSNPITQAFIRKEAEASVRMSHDESAQTHVVGDSVVVGSAVSMDEVMNPVNLESAAALVLSEAAGLDLTSPHGADTPARFLRMLKELTTSEPFNFTTFPSESQNMIIIREIPFSSVCSHHVIPFVGFAHVAYVPDERIAGLSKFARLVRQCAHKLQVQESLTMEIADRIEEILQPKGVGIVMEAEHLCMTIRGVQAPGAKTRTAEMRGVFGDHNKTAKAEFLAAINGSH